MILIPKKWLLILVSLNQEFKNVFDSKNSGKISYKDQKA